GVALFGSFCRLRSRPSSPLFPYTTLFRSASLARALARSPEVLLLDEPFGALDALTRLRMQDLLLEIHAAEPTTVLVVTHDVEEALYLADRVVQLRSLRDAAPGAPSLARTVEVPGARPRDRADHTLAALRAELLEGLGVHGPAPRCAPPPAPATGPPTPPPPRAPGCARASASTAPAPPPPRITHAPPPHPPLLLRPRPLVRRRARRRLLRARGGLRERRRRR